MTGDDRPPRPAELAPGDLVHIARIGALLIVGHPQQHTQPSGRAFVVVDAVRGRRRPAPVIVDADAAVRRLPRDLRRLDFDIDPAGDAVREIRAWSGRGIVGAVSWREHDGALIDIDPPSPHDQLRGFLLFAAQDRCPHLQVPDGAAHWTADAALLTPGELIVVDGGAPLLVVESPSAYAYADGRRFVRVDALFGEQSVSLALDDETDWHRERFDPSTFRFESFPAGDGLRTTRARSAAGATVGEVTWSPYDGTITAIRPAPVLHPLHRLLAAQAADPANRIGEHNDPATLAAGDIIVSGDDEIEILGPAEPDAGGYLSYPVAHRDGQEEWTMVFDPTVPVPRVVAVAGS
ncbi:hypothetical protein G4X40_08020 [Rhodococcus sp. D2-41]|uniref:hypothetical protein n=1 Tax=Speluncibacter jeojiensis TaxID=2710754 RepID=UPI0024106224|nr:hypothetical protein [Rhodococcus sp. D2-41]MDG3010095.1 hypothetical protein [Rhodococcus sp. D2-41]